jgi:xylulokinase
MTHLLGIDLGTSSVKVVLCRLDGSLAGRGSADYPIHHPQTGMAEQEPEEWWQATVQAVRQAIAPAGEAVCVAAMGLCGQMHGTVLMDAHDRLLAPAVIWPDQRSRQQVEEITRTIGPQRLIEITGSPLAVGFQAATLRWFQQERPKIWKRVRRILLPKDYLRWKLTGDLVTDPSDASGTLLLDVRRRDWSAEILQWLEIDFQALPVVQPSPSIAGKLKLGAAQAMGLPPGIPVVAGAGDAAASLLGAGAIRTEQLLLTISSGGQIILPINEVQVDRAGRLHTFCSALEPAPGQAGWYKMGGILAAGLALRWLRDQVLGLNPTDGYDQLTAWAAQAPLGARGLIFLPYLVGERTPHMDPQARGMFLGLTLQHGRPELARAVMEGVTLACYEAYLALVETSTPPLELILAGGGARSSLWRQMAADAFGLPVRRLRSDEQSAIGAALLAGAGIGLFQPGERAQAWASYDPPLEPDLMRHARYQELFELFRSAYRNNRQDFPKYSNF